jgi:GcrA cell cycle regulator
MAPQLAIAEPPKHLPRLKPPTHLTWSNEQIALLIEMYNQGCTMSAIGNRLGKTRSAVGGQLNRLRAHCVEALAPKRFVMHPEGVRAKSTAQPIPSLVLRPKVIRVRPRTPEPRIRLRMIDSETAVTLTELEPHHCRWPNGDPRRSDFRFCGCPRVSLKAKTPYCSRHTLLAGRHYELATEKALRHE